jgi:hypothetical protein
MKLLRKWLRMCEHRDCNEVFVPLWDVVGTCGLRQWYLCNKHKYHAQFSNWHCSSSCND